MNTILQFELISYWEANRELFYWINQHGMIVSPKFLDVESANSFIKQTINFFEQRKKEVNKNG